MNKFIKYQDYLWQKIIVLGTLFVLLIIFFVLFLKSYAYQSGDSLLALDVSNTSETSEHLVSDPLSEPSDDESSDPSSKVVHNISQSILEKIEIYNSANEDTVGWLKIPNTTLDDPIVKADDNDFYLANNFDKEPDNHGAFFADFRNTFSTTESNLSKNTVIYAHSMMDGSMFSQIFAYKRLDFLNSNPIIEFTVNENTENRWKIFCCMVTDVDFYYIETEPSTEAFEKLINEANQRSLFHTSVDVNINDKILTLSTCTYEYLDEDLRFVIMARSLRPGESEHVEPAVNNSDPKQPALKNN